MKRWTWVMMVQVLAAAAVFWAVPAGAQNDKPTIKEIMGRLHKGPNAPLALVKRDLQADEPDWPGIQRMTRDFVTLGTALGKNEPPRGAKDSWARLTRKYAADAQAMDSAAQKQDKQGALAAQARLAGSCMACHKEHRPN